MSRRPPRTSRTDTFFPDTTLCRSSTLLNDHIVESGGRQLSEARGLLDPFEILQACALPRLGLPLFAMFLNQTRKGFSVLAHLCPLLVVFGPRSLHAAPLQGASDAWRRIKTPIPRRR